MAAHFHCRTKEPKFTVAASAETAVEYAHAAAAYPIDAHPTPPLQAQEIFEEHSSAFLSSNTESEPSPNLPTTAKAWADWGGPSASGSKGGAAGTRYPSRPFRARRASHQSPTRPRRYYINILHSKLQQVV